MDINDTAMRYLENRAHTKQEMKEYLLKKGFEEADADDAVQRLSEVRYLDDVSYSAQFLKYGFGKGWSVNRVKQELRKRGVSDNDIVQGIYAYEDENETDIESGEAGRAFVQAEKFMRKSYRQAVCDQRRKTRTDVRQERLCRISSAGDAA